MAAAKVVFHPGASEDYAAAFAGYYSRGSALASDFEREIGRAIRLISQNPLRWPRFDEQRRRFIIRKFPYAITVNKSYPRRRAWQTKTLLLARTRNAATVSRPTSFWFFYGKGDLK